METLVKDEFIVLKKTYIPDFDLSLTVYFKKLGKENIYIPKGQLLKSPYIYYSEPFCWNKGVFAIRRNKIYIEEIDKYKNLSLDIAKDLDKFFTGYFFIKLFLKYITFPDEKLFILLKKSIYYLTKSKNPNIDKLNFLVKFIMLNGLLPEFYLCHRCGVKLSKKNYYGLEREFLSPVCKNCRKKGDKTLLSFDELILLENIKRMKFKDIQNLNLKKERTKKLTDFLKLYLTKFTQ